MTDPPRHTSRERPMVCPGPCNPLRAHHHHAHHRHHHTHHHHRHQKHDTTSVTTARKNLSFLPDEFTPAILLKSLKPDAPVTRAISTDDESISRTSSFARIALIRAISSGPKIPQPKETDIPAIMRQVLSQKKLEVLGEPSTSASAFLRKIDTATPTKTIVAQPEETIVSIAATYQAPRTLMENLKCILTKRLNGLIPKTLSSLFMYLMIFIIYVGIHILIAVITWQTSAYQFFASSQICGILAFLMWRITGTILI